MPNYAKFDFTKISGQQIKDRLLKYEDQIVRTVYKFGVLYCKEGQIVEDDMYCNGTVIITLDDAANVCSLVWFVSPTEFGSPALEEFLDFLGERVKLEGFTGYRGGLDVKSEYTFGFLLNSYLIAY